MKELCDCCIHWDVCKLRDKYTALNKAVEDLLKTEEAEGGEFAIVISCSKWYDRGDYLLK